MYESKIYPTKHEVLVWELEDIIKQLETNNFNQSVADTGNYVADTAVSLIKAAIKKSEEEIHG